MSVKPQVEIVVSEARRESPFTFPMETPDLIAALSEDRKFRIDPMDGKIFFESMAISPLDALENFAIRHPELSGFRKVVFETKDFDGVRSKADLATTADKTQFVRKWGAELFEKLPSIAPDDLTKLPSAAIRKLPVAQRSHLARLLGERGYGELLRRNETL